MRACFVTTDAAAGVRQFAGPLSATRDAIAEAFAESVKVPRRHGRRLLSCQLAGKTAPTVRVSGSMLLVCRGRRVVSVRRLRDSEIATLLTWAATGTWVGGEV